MIDPIFLFLFGTAVMVIATLVFWPEHGHIWRWIRLKQMTDRVLTEDALKHIHECEYLEQTCTRHSISGALSLSVEKAAELTGKLETRDLVERDRQGIRLTSSGRNYALRVIRVHRLWEVYLANETGFPESEWHTKAHHLEHRTSTSEADALEASMGYPKFDPHGDPIPTSQGELLPMRGEPLTSLAPNLMAKIIHIEDEPETLYAKLVAEGLHIGMQLRVVERNPKRIRFWADGNEHILAPALGANVTVARCTEKDTCEFETLSKLAPGERGTVTGISRSCHGVERRRLMDLGILPGTLIRAEMTGPGGDPTAYRIRGAVIALRENQAAKIQIRQTEIKITEGIQ